jgi:aspartyl-tRNA(Asn)/glutamyl-tRNA(Gln) amidotransferase subunit A
MLHTYTLAALRDGLARGDFSSRELTQHFLTRIQQFDGQLNSFITVCADNALAQADAADLARANGSAHALAGYSPRTKRYFLYQRR